MILEQLVIHNFGVYLGRHEIRLAPTSRQKPVILFGGLNGRGKTTLLDALQLVLYGQRAQCSNRGSLAYDEFLRRSIHRSVDPRDGAALELSFKHVFDGKEHSFHVRRAWSLREKNIRDRLEVYHDGALSQLMTEGWAEQIEELMPVRLSKFFFFDGEKIESLADLDHSAEILSTAIHSLLGLDLVDQLVADLLVLERRKRIEQKLGTERDALMRAKEELERIDVKRKELLEERASAQVALERAQKRLREADERFKLGGGDAFEHRKDIERKISAIEERWNSLQLELEEAAASAAPLLLVIDLLTMIAEDDEAERVKAQARELSDLLALRDEKILQTAKSSGAPASVVKALSDFLSLDRQRIVSTEAKSSYLNLSAEARADLSHVGVSLRADLPNRLEKLLVEADRVRREQGDLERKRVSIPDQEAIAALAQERAAAREVLLQAELKLKSIQKEHETVNREYQQKWDAYARLMHKDFDSQVEQESIVRILTHSDKVRQVLKRFRGAILERRIGRIQQLILEGFQYLLHKESLISSLHIDPSRLSITLIGRDGKELAPERLSAGERQLLAIATIWAITRASGRPLPVAIDTPLGRLDSVHRKHLIERYFPDASHQVLLLSTDKEIDKSFFAKLEPAISHSYILSYSDHTGSTTIKPGYFWS